MELDDTARQHFQRRYQIKSLLGKGSFGCVYECLDNEDNMVYAVKLISKNGVKKSKIDCLREEFKILSGVSHQNVVRVHEFVETEGYLYLKMEVLRNGTLEQLIRKRWDSGQHFNDHEIAEIMSSLFRSLSHIHSLSIIHRDIKPGNQMEQEVGNIPE